MCGDVCVWVKTVLAAKIAFAFVNWVGGRTENVHR